MNQFKLLLCVAALALLNGCNTPAKVIKVDEQTQNDIFSFQSNPSAARIYIFTGKIKGSLFNSNHSFPADIYVNTVQIGSINKENVMYFELNPGNYDFSWIPRNTDLIVKQSVSLKSNFDVLPGQILVLRGDYDYGGSNFGLIGAMINRPTTFIVAALQEDVLKKKVVTPQTCDASLCIK
jgi:hypothetical protein